MRFLTKTVLTMILLVVLSVNAYAADLKETAYERVLRTRTLRCGYGIFAPQTMKDPNTGKFSGTFVDVMQNIGKELDIKIEYTEEVDWGSIATDLNSGRIDAFCPGMWGTAKRGAHIGFSRPVYYSTIEAYVRADDTRFDHDKTKINDPGIIIATNDGDVTEEIANRFFPKARHFAKGNVSDETFLLVNVITKKADITFTAPSIAKAFMKKNPGKLRQVSLPEPILVYPNVIGVNIHEHELIHMLDAAILQLENNGSVKEILDGYEDGKFFRLPVKPYE
jgi:polar amino acid transport system substrate-binding protein